MKSPRNTHAARLAGLLLASAALAPTDAFALPPTGDPVLNAHLEDADGHRTSLAAFTGKPMLIVYEDQDSSGVNQALKDDLSKLAKGGAYRSKVAMLPLADVSSYDFWPVKGFVKDAIREESRKVGTVIYCDWDGSFRQTLGIEAGTSSVILVGKSGRVLFARQGALSKSERAQLVDLLKGQVGE